MIRRKNSAVAGVFLLLSAIFSAAFAQPAQAIRTPNDTLKSPEVLSDNRVVFRVYAPKASEVTVGSDWIAQGLGTGGKLTKDNKGV